MSLLLKICGLAREEDVRQTVMLSPDALGFVFWPRSPRAVTPENVRAWTQDVPSRVLKVGVFVNQPVSEVRKTAEHAGLDIVQLHGEEDGAYMDELARPVWKAGSLKRFQSETVLPKSAWLRAWLIDSGTPQMPGGTGIPVNWVEAAEVVKTLDLPVWLAGGLQKDNLEQAVNAVGPWGVDVSSGVEAEPGCKDMKAVRDFLAVGRKVGT